MTEDETAKVLAECDGVASEWAKALTESNSLAVRSEATKTLAVYAKRLADHCRKLVADDTRLKEAIWPGLPKWEPTAAQPQQDFYEALIEALRAEPGRAGIENEQYRQVFQEGKRLPAPELGQDAAFAAFTLGKLEAEIAELKAIKVAVQTTPKQWSTALAPTMEALVASVGQVKTQSESERLLQAIEILTRERAHLLNFKRYVHDRLDAGGVSVDPESVHKAEGCRIGGRLDEVFAERSNVRAALADVVASLANYRRCLDDFALSPYIRENGRHTGDRRSSPWAELIDDAGRAAQVLAPAKPAEAA